MQSSFKSPAVQSSLAIHSWLSFPLWRAEVLKSPEEVRGTGNPRLLRQKASLSLSEAQRTQQRERDLWAGSPRLARRPGGLPISPRGCGLGQARATECAPNVQPTLATSPLTLGEEDFTSLLGVPEEAWLWEMLRTDEV